MNKEHAVVLKKKKYNLFTDIKRNPYSYILILPAMLYVFIFGYLPLPYIAIAFQKFNYRTGLFGSEFVGLRNFQFFFKSPSFLQITFNTLLLNTCFIIVVAVVSITFAIMLNEIRAKLFKKVTQAMFLLPYFMSWVVVSYVVFALLATELGVINQILRSIGAQPYGWYTSPGPWRVILIMAKAWKDVGMQVIIYLAAITGLDVALNEAARIDGANRWQIVRHITLPQLLPTVSILMLLAVGRIFYGDFGMIYALIGDNGVLFPKTDVIDTYVFRSLRKIGDPSQAMAVGLYQSLMGFIFVFVSNRLARRNVEGGALF